MGQRSQIYVVLHNGNENIENWGKNRSLVALYNGWNYGERMISRVRQIVEYLNVNILQKGYLFSENETKLNIKAFADANLDMRDVTNKCSDIVKECWVNNEDWLFSQDNNDGRAFILCDLKNKKTKYVFDDGDNKKWMNGEEYIRWDLKYWDEKTKSYLDEKNTPVENIKYFEEYCDENVKHALKENLSYLNEFEILSEIEVNDYFFNGKWDEKEMIEYEKNMALYELAKTLVGTDLITNDKLFELLEKIDNYGINYRIRYFD